MTTPRDSCPSQLSPPCGLLLLIVFMGLSQLGGDPTHAWVPAPSTVDQLWVTGLSHPAPRSCSRRGPVALTQDDWLRWEFLPHLPELPITLPHSPSHPLLVSTLLRSHHPVWSLALQVGQSLTVPQEIISLGCV